MSRRWGCRGRRDRCGGLDAAGFSLLEALAVIGVLAIASALRTAAAELKENLEFAKSLAVKENRTAVVELSPQEGRYRISLRTAAGDLEPVRTQSLPPPVRFDTAHPAYTVSHERLSFNSRGGADNCTIVLSTPADRSRRVTVSTIGKIQIES